VVSAVSEAVSVVDGDADVLAEADSVELAEAEAEAEADGEADADAVGVGVGVADVAVDVDVDVADELGVAEGLGLGEEVLVTVTSSHCWVVALAADTSASAGVAPATPNAMAATPVTRIPPAARPLATGRTRVKHIRDVLVASAERLIGDDRLHTHI